MTERTRRRFLRPLTRTLLAVGMLLAVGRCDLTTPVERESLVVEAFLKTSRSLPTITLRQTRPLDDPGDPRAHVAMGAEIELVVDGEVVPYETARSEPGVYVPSGTAGRVPPRVPWRLTVRWRGETAHAQGRTPPPIDLTEMCVEVPERPVQAILVDSLHRDSLNIPAEQGYLYPVNVSVRWPAEALSAGEDTTHWVRPRLSPDTAESSSRVVNVFLEPVEVRREDQFRLREGQRRWKGVYAVPVDDSTSPFPRHALTATLTRGHTAFAAFARSRNDPQRREPISNVNGGLGIATAVAVDSLRRDVAPDRQRCRSR